MRPTRLLAATLTFVALPALAAAHGISAEDQQLMSSGGLAAYVRLGAIHMVTGYDHLLFLFGVVFFLTSMLDVVKFVTAFTVGHSITLIAATFAGISANYFLIDAVIALTVCYKGFDNLDGFERYLKTQRPNLVAMVFTFGLIHGFGLSTRLQQLPLGDEGLLLKIISFNVGVELGQVAALLLMLVALELWRKTDGFQQLSNAANTGLIILGGLLFLMQMHGYSHELEARDAAHHAHDTATTAPPEAPHPAPTPPTNADHPTQAPPPPTPAAQPHAHGDDNHSHDHPDHADDQAGNDQKTPKPHSHGKVDPAPAAKPAKSTHSHGGHTHSH